MKVDPFSSLLVSMQSTGLVVMQQTIHKAEILLLCALIIQYNMYIQVIILSVDIMVRVTALPGIPYINQNEVLLKKDWMKSYTQSIFNMNLSHCGICDPFQKGM